MLSRASAVGAEKMSTAERLWLEDVLGPAGPVTLKPMFGGFALSISGATIGIAIDRTIWLKTSAATIGLFKAAGSEPFSYERATGTIVTRFWRLPDAALDDPDGLLRWIGLARQSAEENEEKKPRKPKKSGFKQPGT
jgi:DNA transformation protein and related proteins